MSLLVLLALVGAALLSVPVLANASPSPYPPVNPSSGVAPTAAHRDPSTGHTTHQSGETASTGFATLTATGIALALVGGGVFFVVAGRRRRRA